MTDFWQNVSRYPRFFISSLTGSILVILAPLRNSAKTPKLRNLFFLIGFIGVLMLFAILVNMTGM